MLMEAEQGGIMPMFTPMSTRRRNRVTALSAGIMAAAMIASALAADPEAFVAGTSRNCVECDFAGRDLKARDFKRAKLDRASFKNADLAGASLFRASLVRADFSGAKLVEAN